MGFFSKDKSEVEDSSEKTEKSGKWGSQLSQAIADARARGVGVKEGSSKGSKDTGKKSSGASVSRELSEAAKKMFDPDAWRAIVRAPFALGKVVTGRECWELEKKQEDTLATSTAMTAEYFMNVDPKYVALTICMFNWSVVLTEKYAANAKLARLEKASEPQPVTSPGLSAIK
jgi:hypothetical protein